MRRSIHFYANQFPLMNLSRSIRESSWSTQLLAVRPVAGAFAMSLASSQTHSRLCPHPRRGLVDPISDPPPPQHWLLSVRRVLRTKPPPTRPPRPTHPQQPTRMSWAVAIGPVWPAVRPARAAPVTTWAAVALHRSTVVSYLRSALPRIQGNFFHHNPRSFVEPRIKALRFESLLVLYIQLSVLLTTVNFNEGPNVRFGLYSKFLLVLN